MLVDSLDLPVCPDYSEAVRETGVRIRRTSRWLNALSVAATAQQVAVLRALSCVRSVEQFRLRAVVDPFLPRSTMDDPNYGASLRQNLISHVPELHARGLTGQGILMCMLDTGARLEHDAFDSLNVIATYDFYL